MGGATALPSRAKACVMPCAKPRLPGAVQFCMARVAVGKVAPSPKPRSTRARNRLMRPPTIPVRIVAEAQIRPQTRSVRLAPNLSPTDPPMTWKMA